MIHQTKKNPKCETKILNLTNHVLLLFNRKELFYTGPSGISLIGIGPTAEVMVPKITDDVITGNGVFLCDMGSQYL